MRDPAVLFYTGDFLNGCADLTIEERGQYITLLCIQHQKGHLSEKTIRLSVGSVSDDVMKKFIKDEEGNFFNERMESESEKRAAFTNSCRANGSKGGRPEKEKPNDKSKNNLVVKHKGNLMGNENRNENRNENVIEEKTPQEKKQSKSTPPVIPSEIKPVIDKWIEMRKKKRNPPTDYAIELALKELEKLAPNDFDKQISIINQSITSGWADFYQLKDKNTSKNGQHSNSQPPSISTGTKYNGLV